MKRNRITGEIEDEYEVNAYVNGTGGINISTMHGYTFGGWSTNKNAIEVPGIEDATLYPTGEYPTDEQVPTGELVSKENKWWVIRPGHESDEQFLLDTGDTWYAIWIGAMNITVNFMNGTEIIASRTTFNGGSVTAPTADELMAKGINPSDLRGWDKKYTGIKNPHPAERMTLEIQAVFGTNRISFNLRGGSPAISPIIAEAGEDISSQAASIRTIVPTKVGYIFEGWTDEIPDIMPDYDLTISAEWEPEPEPPTPEPEPPTPEPEP